MMNGDKARWKATVQLTCREKLRGTLSVMHLDVSGASFNMCDKCTRAQIVCVKKLESSFSRLLYSGSRQSNNHSKFLQTTCFVLIGPPGSDNLNGHTSVNQGSSGVNMGLIWVVHDLKFNNLVGNIHLSPMLFHFTSEKKTLN